MAEWIEPARRPDRLLRPADALVLVLIAQIVIHASWAILGWRDASMMIILEIVWILAALNGLTAIGKLARQYHGQNEALAGNVEPRASASVSVGAHRTGLGDRVA